MTKRLTLLAVVLLMVVSTVMGQLTNKQLHPVNDPGVPAYPYPIVFDQPNGKKLMMVLKGDGALNWGETLDGHKLLKNKNGAYCYAIEDAANGIKASDVVASNQSERTSQELELLSKTNKNATFSSRFIQLAKEKKATFLKSTDAPSKSFPTKGTTKLLAILVQFADVPFSNTNDAFNNLFNQKGYSVSGSTGSVSDFFYDNSFGKMNLSVDVVGPYTLSQNMSYYGKNDNSGSDSNPQAMVTEAVALADKDVDFSKYDNDKDGTIDGIYIIYAGYGEEAGASSDAIWAHAWQIPTKTYDNTKISHYSCSAECNGNINNNITKTPTYIGVICHEFLHVCGLPDLYDTDYESSGGEGNGAGKWDPMSSGSWNNSGKTPPFVNCYSRSLLNWGTIEPLPTGKSIEIQPHYTSTVGYSASNIENETYYFENRQRKSWDAYLPYHGMIVYHMQYNATVWDNNTINVNPDHQYFDLIEAAGEQGAAASNPFPGSSKVTSFTFNTTPAFVNWNGTSLNTPIVNISENNEIITADVKTTYCLNLVITDGTNAINAATVTVNGKMLTSNSSGVANYSNLDPSTALSIKVEKSGYQTYEETFAVPEGGFSVDMVKNIIIKAPVHDYTFKVVNGSNSITGFTMSYNGVKYTPSGTGIVTIPIPENDLNPTYTLTFSDYNQFTDKIQLNTSNFSYTISVKKYTVELIGRWSDVPTVNFQLFSNANIVLKGNEPQVIYASMSNQFVGYLVTFDNGQSISKNFTSNGANEESILLNVNKYKFSFTAENSPVSSTIVYLDKSSYITSMDGTVSYYVDGSTSQVLLTMESGIYFGINQTIDNLKAPSQLINVNLIKRFNSENLKVAPNPIATLPINVYVTKDGTIDIYSVSGNIVHTQNVFVGKNQVTFAKPAGGVYVVLFRSGSISERCKVIIL